MRKLFFLVLLLLSFQSFSDTLSFKVEKETNGGYLYSIPHLEIENHKDLFLHKLNLDLLFTNQRGEQGTPNHYGIAINNAFGVEKNNAFLTFSLDIKYVFDENDYKEEEGLKFGNTLEFGIKF